VARSEYHDDSQSEATRTVEHGYDAQNRWIKTSLDADGAGEGAAVDRFFVYDGNQIILQLDDSGDPAHRYLWGPAVDQLLADEAVAGEVTWPLTDHLGTIRDWAAYDDETTIVNHILYDAFGRITEETNPADHLFYFTARPLEKETGLQNNLHRWYEPPTGKWLSEDPIGFDAGDGNLYRYVGNRTTDATDPVGLWSEDVHYDLTLSLAKRAGYKYVLFCLSRTLSFDDVLEFSTARQEKLDVKAKVFHA